MDIGIGIDLKYIATLVLLGVGIWAVIELALTIRKSRNAVEKLTKEVQTVSATANETIEQLQPIVTKVDGMVEDLQPAVAQAMPLLEKAGTVIDVATVDLASVNDILVDVSSVTDTASNVTSTVSKATNSAVSGVAGVVGKFTGGSRKKRHAKLAEKSASSAAAPEHASVQVPEEDDTPAEKHDEPSSASYFTYGE